MKCTFKSKDNEKLSHYKKSGLLNIEIYYQAYKIWTSVRGQ